jgi:NADH dehydrogenase/NADH:ubiquinone oxidoreductase subunit G
MRPSSSTERDRPEVSFTLNGQTVQAPEGTTILDVCRKRGIEIPTLCWHEALSPYGACRLCIVEVRYNGRRRLVTSCIYEVWEGLEVETDSEWVLKTRRLIMELILAEAPDSPRIRQVARSMGVEGTRFPLKNKGCILCGLCVRACEEIVGLSCIGFAQRGYQREVLQPFKEPSATCIACGACAWVCPTGYISLEDQDGMRRLNPWGVERPLARCERCGAFWAPKAQLEYFGRLTGHSPEFFQVCHHCRQTA